MLPITGQVQQHMGEVFPMTIKVQTLRTSMRLIFQSQKARTGIFGQFSPSSWSCRSVLVEIARIVREYACDCTFRHWRLLIMLMTQN